MNDNLSVFIMLIAITGLLSCVLALMINRYLKTKIVMYMIIIFLSLFIAGAVIMINPGETYYNEIYNISLVSEKNNISGDFAFMTAKMSGIISYEGLFHGGILRQYSFTDIKPLFPELKESYSESQVIVWAYELQPKSIIKRGKNLYLTGDRGKPDTIYYSLISKRVLYNSTSLFCDEDVKEFLR